MTATTLRRGRRAPSGPSSTPGLRTPLRAAVRPPRRLKGRVVALDTETTGLHPHLGDRVFCIGYMTERGEYGVLRKTREALDWVASLFANPKLTVIFHNAKFDLKMLSYDGVEVYDTKAKIECTLILSKLFNMNGARHSHSLERLAPYYLNRVNDEKVEIKDWLKKRNTKAQVRNRGRVLTFADVPDDIVARRVLWDVKSTLLLWYYLNPRVTSQCPELYKTELRLQRCCMDMETTGQRIDITRARELKAEAEDGLRKIKYELARLCCPLTAHYKAGPQRVVADDFNPGSDRHLAGAFNAVGLKLRYKTTKGNWCFDDYAMLRYVSKPLAAVMRESSEAGWKPQQFLDAVHDVIEEHDLHRRELVPPLVLKYRTLSKMVSTYYDHFIENCADREVVNGREYGILHGNFNQTGANTGRFSSSDPNLQNMPRLLGPRECFVARKGRYNFCIDYAQVEMRFFAHFAEDRHMADAIAEDVHLHVAARIYRVAPEDVTKEQRYRAKTLNFGILYGAGPKKLAEMLTRMGLPTSELETAALYAAYHREFPTVRKLTRYYERVLRRNGYIQNPFGRRYHIHGGESYKCLNYMCQGTPADLMKRAMVELWEWLRSRKGKARLLSTVHDELILECPPSEMHEVVPKAMQIMEDLTSYYVPMPVDADVVRTRWSKKEKPEVVGLRLAA